MANKIKFLFMFMLIGCDEVNPRRFMDLTGRVSEFCYRGFLYAKIGTGVPVFNQFGMPMRCPTDPEAKAGHGI